MSKPQVVYKKSAKQFKKKSSKAATKGYVQKEIQKAIDLDFKDTQNQVLAANTTIADTSLTNLLTGLVTGDNPQQREGKKINLKSVEIRGYIRNVLSTIGSPQSIIVRCLLVQRKYPDFNATPAVRDVFYNDVFNVTGAYSNSSYVNLRELGKGNAKKYKVLWDRYINVGSINANYTDNAGEKTFHKFIKFKDGVSVTYDNNTDLTADARLNHLWLLFMPNYTVVSGGPNITFRARIRYNR